ncbi:MAG: hypothetical protein ACOYLR_10970 [Chlorobium sp.]
MRRLEKQFFEIPTFGLAETVQGKIFAGMLPGNIQLKGRIISYRGISGRYDLPSRKYTLDHPYLLKVRLPE